MKIKKQQGTREFMSQMNFRSKFPRVDKLLVRRKKLIEHATLEPGMLDVVIKKIHKIDLELQRHSPAVNEAGFYLGPSD
jgi:hypothetical protein